MVGARGTGEGVLPGGGRRGGSISKMESSGVLCCGVSLVLY